MLITSNVLSSVTIIHYLLALSGQTMAISTHSKSTDCKLSSWLLICFQLENHLPMFRLTSSKLRIPLSKVLLICFADLCFSQSVNRKSLVSNAVDCIAIFNFLVICTPCTHLVDYHTLSTDINLRDYGHINTPVVS